MEASTKQSTQRRGGKGARHGTARNAAETALDVVIGGTALAADKAAETFDEVTGRTEEAVREKSRALRRKAAETTRAAREAIDERDGRAYEDRTRDELYELASEREIEGRSSMRKAELIHALRAQR